MKNVMIFLDKHYKTVLLFLGVCLAFYLITSVTTCKPQMPPEYKAAIDSLTKQNKELIEKQEALDETIEAYRQEVNEIDFQIKNIKEKTTIVREYYRDVNQRVNTYTPSQIDSFLKQRYNY